MARTSKRKISMEFSGFSEALEKLKKIGEAETMRAVEGALKSSQQVVARQCAAAMTPHNHTGTTAALIIRDGAVKWVGDKAEIEVGFRLPEGLPAQFLMYGTKSPSKVGQTHVPQDKALYDAVFGKKTRTEIKRLQKQAFEKVVERVTKK